MDPSHLVQAVRTPLLDIHCCSLISEANWERLLEVVEGVEGVDGR